MRPTAWTSTSRRSEGAVTTTMSRTLAPLFLTADVLDEFTAWCMEGRRDYAIEVQSRPAAPLRLAWVVQ